MTFMADLVINRKVLFSFSLSYVMCLCAACTNQNHHHEVERQKFSSFVDTITLTISPPASCENAQCLSQCQALHRLVRSSNTLVNWILNNFWSTESIFKHLCVLLKTLNALCVCLQYKHPISIKRVSRSGKPITSVFPVKSQKMRDFGAEPRCRLFATSAGKGLIVTSLRNTQCRDVFKPDHWSTVAVVTTVRTMLFNLR
jgi:hypothetical protein